MSIIWAFNRQCSVYGIVQKSVLYKTNNIRQNFKEVQKKYNLVESKKVWSSKLSGSKENRDQIPSAYCFL